MAKPDTINSNALSGKIAVLATVKLDRLDELLENGNWEAALNLISDIDADAKSVCRSCTALASKVNKRHWSPLFEQQQQEGSDA